MPVIAMAAVAHSVLYLGGCFVAGLLLHQPAAWRLALISAGCAYLGEMMQCCGNTVEPNRYDMAGAKVAICASIVSGALAGLTLLVD